jgi:hypothetical protein
MDAQREFSRCVYTRSVLLSLLACFSCTKTYHIHCWLPVCCFGVRIVWKQANIDCFAVFVLQRSI